jgi:MFS family permease
MSSADVGIAGALYIAGACLGALFFGQLTTATGARSSHGHAWRLPARDGPDRVRRRVCAYLGSAALVVVLGILLRNGSLTTTAFMALIMATFFLASAGASSAYLTVSEVFPMETRGLAIALFYAAGTAVGGITGPLLFGNFIHSGNVSLVATGFFIGAAAMALGGIAELLFGVRAEGKSLENIATPLTAEDAEADPRRQGEIQAVRKRNRRTEQEHEAARTRSMRILRRAAERAERERAGLRRVRPGTGNAFYSPGQLGTAGTASRWHAASDQELDRELDAISGALDEHGVAQRGALAGYVGALGPVPVDVVVRPLNALRTDRSSRVPEFAPTGPTRPGAPMPLS